MAGFRGQAPLVVFLFARADAAAVLLRRRPVLSLLRMLELRPAAVDQDSASPSVVAYIGFYAPNLYVSNIISKRQQSIRRAWPDALDLLLICVESGMAAEPAFRKVSEEIGAQSIPLAEELTLTTAELSYLAGSPPGLRESLDADRPRRRQGGDDRLVQAERYGTPLGTALRVLAQESRDQRMNDAEKKAAALPPKLTVPMILFFLPVLFGVIIGPAAIQIMATQQVNGRNPARRSGARHRAARSSWREVEGEASDACRWGEARPLPMLATRWVLSFCQLFGWSSIDFR